MSEYCIIDTYILSPNIPTDCCLDEVIEHTWRDYTTQSHICSHWQIISRSNTYFAVARCEKTEEQAGAELGQTQLANYT